MKKNQNLFVTGVTHNKKEMFILGHVTLKAMIANRLHENVGSVTVP